MKITRDYVEQLAFQNELIKVICHRSQVTDHKSKKPSHLSQDSVGQEVEEANTCVGHLMGILDFFLGSHVVGGRSFGVSQYVYSSTQDPELIGRTNTCGSSLLLGSGPLLCALGPGLTALWFKVY